MAGTGAWCCELPADATRTDVTYHARAGCVACQHDRRNLDALNLPVMDPIDVDHGETLCRQCRQAVFVQPTLQGAYVVDPDGRPHRHDGASRTPEAARVLGVEPPTL